MITTKNLGNFPL